jgi:hypothetical protein
VIHPLADQFKRRLGSISFFLRHVKVINENTAFGARRRSENTLSALFHFLVNTSLGLESGSLSREVNRHHVESFVHFKVKELRNVNGFTSSSRSSAEDVLLQLEEGLH